METSQPLVVVYGPTASGKTSLSIAVARQCRGEIISADSRAIYRGLDIGAAKPSMTERSGVPHWGFDLVNPGERFTAADFKLYALRKISEIRARGNVPFIVGGTGLYIDSVVFDYQFPDDKNTTLLRQQLESHDIDYISKYCVDNNIKLPENHKNKRYLINAIIRNGATAARRCVPRGDAILLGVENDRQVLRTRIEARGRQIFEAGGLEEARSVAATYGWDSEAMTGNIYRLAREYFAGAMSYDMALQKSITADWRLAKRQLTWLRRNQYIEWLPQEQAQDYLISRLMTTDMI